MKEKPLFFSISLSVLCKVDRNNNKRATGIHNHVYCLAYWDMAKAILFLNCTMQDFALELTTVDLYQKVHKT